MARRTRRIGIAFPVMPAHLELVYRGVLAYAREQKNWSLMVSPESYAVPVRWLDGWRGDGALVMVLNRRDAQIAATLPMPVVTIASSVREPGVARVSVDHVAVGRMAAEHLLEQGFRRLAYYGLREVWYAQQRGQGFVQAAQRAGVPVAQHRGRAFGRSATHWQDELQSLVRWLGTMKTPVGIFASSDQRARMLIDACRHVGLQVPQQVAVVGVDNDEATCTLETPTLSSIGCNSFRVGYEAAKLLNRRMQGQRTADEVRIPPQSLTVRQSSDTYTCEDPVVAAAVGFIREHLAEPFGVDDLTRAAGVSRRWLEHRFTRTVGCTPHVFINRQRLAKAQRLLAGPERLTLTETARRCGFRDARRLREVARRHGKQAGVVGRLST